MSPSPRAHGAVLQCAVSAERCELVYSTVILRRRDVSCSFQPASHHHHHHQSTSHHHHQQLLYYSLLHLHHRRPYQSLSRYGFYALLCCAPPATWSQVTVTVTGQVAAAGGWKVDAGLCASVCVCEREREREREREWGVSECV